MSRLLLLKLALASLGCSCSNPDQPQSPYREMCELAWAETGRSQRAEFASKDAFLTRCGASLWVSQCKDGRVAFAGEGEGICRLNGGVAHDLKFPDG